MKNYADVIGIDISRLTIDAHLHRKGSHRLFSNTTKGFIKLLSWIKKEVGLSPVFYCF